MCISSILLLSSNKVQLSFKLKSQSLWKVYASQFNLPALGIWNKCTEALGLGNQLWIAASPAGRCFKWCNRGYSALRIRAEILCFTAEPQSSMSLVALKSEDGNSGVNLEHKEICLILFLWWCSYEALPEHIVFMCREWMSCFNSNTTWPVTLQWLCSKRKIPSPRLLIIFIDHPQAKIPILTIGGDTVNIRVWISKEWSATVGKDIRKSIWHRLLMTQADNRACHICSVTLVI